MRIANSLSMGSRVLASALFLALLSSCSGSAKSERAGIDPKPEVAAPAKIADAFLATSPLKAGVRATAVGDTDLSLNEDNLLVLKKAALEKEFLLHANLIPQTGANTSHGLSARVVAFRKAGNRVFLLEATQGHVVTNDLPATLILTDFPILKETETNLVLDFNAGMSQVFVTGNWYASDESGNTFDPNMSAAPITRSFIRSIGLEGNSLVVSQIAQVSESTGLSNYEVRYFLSPYHPNPDFVPRVTSDFTRVGFFEVSPVLETTTGRTITRISRWDDRAPITYAISANTPADYVDAIRDGILYWNQVFGREVLRVIVAPQGVTAPDSRYNIIQWVPNDSAGSAYADALMDPRSGEILHSQVYLTSVFGVNSRSKMASVLRKLKLVTESSAAAKPSLAIRFLAPSQLCNHPIHSSFADNLEKLAQAGMDDATFLRLTRDYIRHVVAHEVGHTMGLRHNFAGSLGATMSAEQIDRAFMNYAIHNEVPLGQVLTTSVMEYSENADSILESALNRAEGAIGSYDRMAIRWGYEGQAIDAATAPLFCSDSHSDVFKDCKRFDQGSKPIVSNQYLIGKAIAQAPGTFAELFIRAKTAYDVRDRLPFDRVVIDPAASAKTITDLLKDQVSWMKSGSFRLISIERQFPFVSSFYSDEIKARQNDLVAAQFAQAGGVDASLFSLVPTPERPSLGFAEAATRGLHDYLAREEVRRGLGWDGKPYELTSDEIAAIETLGQKFFQQMEAKIITGAVDALSGSAYTHPKLASQAELKLGAVAKQILLAPSEQTIEGTGANGTQPVYGFAYSKEDRLKATALLNASLGNVGDWSMEARTEVLKKLKETALKGIGADDPSKVDPLTLARPLRQWYLDQTDVIRAIQASAQK